jgi:hypothetical protein
LVLPLRGNMGNMGTDGALFRFSGALSLTIKEDSL